MKRVVLSAFLLMGLCNVAHAQQEGFRVGAHGGFPLSDASDFSSFNVGVDASYLFKINDKIAGGLATGYSTFLGKDGFDDYSYIPVAASFRMPQGKKFFYTADVGYAVATTKDADGGLYVVPKIGWTNNKLDVLVFYKSVNAGDASVASIGLGVGYKL